MTNQAQNKDSKLNPAQTDAMRKQEQRPADQSKKPAGSTTGSTGSNYGSSQGNR